MQKQSYGDYEAPRIAAPTRGARVRAQAPAGAAEAVDVAEARTAVIVVHGMGQQLTFQTLDQVVNGLQNEHKEQLAAGGLPPDEADAMVGIVHPNVDGVGDRLVPRATLSLTRVQEGAAAGKVGVDFYECYWAPLTQGAIGIKAVMGFLFDAGRNGLRNAGTGLSQTMFGRDVELQEERRTAIWLWIALICIGCLVLLNAITTLVAAVKIFSKSAPAWLGPELIDSVTWTVMLTIGSLGVTLGLTLLLRSMLLFYAAILVLILGSLALAYVLAANRLGWHVPFEFGDLHTVVVILVWLALLWVSWKVRGLIVQYIGDVAVYVQPHKLGMFDKLRAEIKAEARAIGKVVYGQRDAQGKPQYDRVMIVGHSLGSVVAYDMLNDRMVRDLADGEPNDVIARTRLLLTFGSPLDKITFLFRSQGRAGAKTRERLAAARQPLILDYANRAHMRWVNVHSPKDIISGPLDYFDDPTDTAHEPLHVENLVDPECRYPLAAHVEYWGNRLVFRTLYEALVEEEPTEPEVAAAVE